MVKKKGFMKTLEMLLVIILTAMFLTIVLPRNNINDKTQNSFYLINLAQIDSFRDFVINSESCFNSSTNVSDIGIVNLKNYLGEEFDFVFCINTLPLSLPEKTIYLDTLFFSGNVSNPNYKTLRLYYWYKG